MVLPLWSIPLGKPGNVGSCLKGIVDAAEFIIILCAVLPDAPALPTPV